MIEYCLSFMPVAKAFSASLSMTLSFGVVMPREMQRQYATERVDRHRRIAGTDGSASSFSMAGRSGSPSGDRRTDRHLRRSDREQAHRSRRLLGLVITDGSLASLNMTSIPSSTVADVAFDATNLNFDYVAAANELSRQLLDGGKVARDRREDRRTLCHLRRPDCEPVTDPADYYGLIIQNGSLVSLNMTVNASSRWPTSHSTPPT